MVMEIKLIVVVVCLYLLFSAKNRIYIYEQNTHTESGAENSLFQYWLTIKKPFSPSYLEEKTIYWSLSAWWVYCLVSRAVSQLIMYYTYGGRELPIEKSAFIFSCNCFPVSIQKKSESKIKWNQNKMKWIQSKMR